MREFRRRNRNIQDGLLVKTFLCIHAFENERDCALVLVQLKFVAAKMSINKATKYVLQL